MPLSETSPKVALGPYLFSNILANGTFVLRSGGFALLHSIVINKPGSADWVITVYNNGAGSGAKVATITVGTIFVGQLEYNADCDGGLTIVTAGTTPGDITVMYR